ncbi:MAG: sodium:calcium antiporter [Chloroflexi bacterium]|nr:sodium:calcium antiporter [Chloroflexota bacterium]
MTMVWVTFLLSAAAIAYVAVQLARYGDAIALRTRLGGMFIGVLLLAGATSLPELLTSLSAVNQGSPDLAAGNLLGSNAFNMLLLAILDAVHRNQRILRRAAVRHALSGSLATLMTALVLFLMLGNIDLQVGWVGVDGLLIIGAYVTAVWLIQDNAPPPADHSASAIPEDTPSLAWSLVGFVAAAGAMAVITPIMVRNANEISEITGLGATFVGTTLVALVTSLPELVTTLAAARIGADDMAIGNLFGSTMFNMFAIGLTDVFFVSGRFLGAIDPSFLLVGMLGLLMTALALVGNLARLERRVLFIEMDALALIVAYLGGMWLVYIQSVGS